MHPIPIRHNTMIPIALPAAIHQANLSSLKVLPRRVRP